MSRQIVTNSPKITLFQALKNKTNFVRERSSRQSSELDNNTFGSPKDTEHEDTEGPRREANTLTIGRIGEPNILYKMVFDIM